ncbi:IS200/IS605 family transposase [Gracilimonas sp. BCB1]|uniref:IS200/IS605 family transposase n=1 Tax=Gracilimonas sp. BCB1 TaxID=3152362 RepID=UPI0032D90608
MPQSYSNNWIHCVWRTKNSRKILLKSFRYELFIHIKGYADRHDITLDVINGVLDHVHALIRLKTTQSVADIVGALKGESSFWVNKNVILDERFEWQAGYGVISVSPHEIDRIRSYIYGQELHHMNKTLKEEVVEFTKNIHKQRPSGLQ